MRGSVGNVRVAGLLAVLPLVLLAACNPTSRKLGNLALNYVRGTNEKVARETAAAIPYATMGLEYGFSPQVLLVLGQTTGGQLDWYAGDQLYVATRQGRLVRTVGLPNDLGGRRAPSGQQPGSSAIAYILDFPDMGVFGAAALCSSTDTGESMVEIFGTAIPTRHVVEHCSVPALRWTFDNEYWEDRMTRYVWRSRQYVHPKSPPIVLEIFRPEDTAG